MWQRVYLHLLRGLWLAGRLELAEVLVDAGWVKAPLGVQTGPNPTDRGKAGSKHDVVTDANGIPLAAKVTAANKHDVNQFVLLDSSIPPVDGKPGRPRQRPDRVRADRACDSGPHRRLLRWLGIRPVLARRHKEHDRGLGVYRWLVERTLRWLHQYWRFRIH